MPDHEKCINCDSHNADCENRERNGQTINACDLCRMTGEDWRKFMMTVEG